ncbi:hypothetical protein ACRAQ7_02110 [Erythrobacter sp. W53]|uniref:hypothetical protein n=1 Tax=Erythrobacteraceae TaxID=335929 RepID=UPI0036D37F94
MHLPPYFLEAAALIFAALGGLIAWRTHWNVIVVALVASGILLFAQIVLHMTDDDTVSLMNDQDPLAFYAMMSALGLVPAITGAWLIRLFKRWREK